jgi:hypothetical protein
VSDHVTRRRRRRRTTVWLRVAGVAVATALVFLLGIALGQALDAAPEQGTRTQVRTLRPLALAPARETVTVTVP